MPRRMEDESLQDPQNWDWSQAERRPGSGASRAVVSVAFPATDFDLVSEAAERMGVKLSQFIRAAAVEKARPHTESLRILLATSSNGFSPFTLPSRPIPTVENQGWSAEMQEDGAKKAITR
ncbi:MAG: hypothetical protein ACYDCQ_02255 [Dehalococcoidia bacterium]